MKHSLLLILAAATLLAGCASQESKRAAAAAQTGAKQASDGKSSADDLDTYATVASVADPLEPVNRVTFWINHQLYTYALHPISEGYKFLVPEKGREALYNAFENIKFPVRLANNLLQGRFTRAGQETGAFLVNSTVGIGGLGRPAQHIPALANIPVADTGQTFAKWGIPNGLYLVIPVLGPSTAREIVGQAGDWALNPVTWCGYIFGSPIWYIAIPSANTMRSLPYQLDVYDAATREAIDRYLATRNAYIQYRNEVNSR